MVLRDIDGTETTVRAPPNTQFERIISAYVVHARRRGRRLHAGDLRLIFEGVRCMGHATPASVGVEDGDTIDVLRGQGSPLVAEEGAYDDDEDDDDGNDASRRHHDPRNDEVVVLDGKLDEPR